jgi:hypothetical protein
MSIGLTLKMQRPHIVILGAGASKATCQEDKNGKKLPIMNDFAEIVGLTQLLISWGINPNKNFEEIFSDLYDSGESQKVERLEYLVREYFQQLELPESPNIYDHLILSLRETDLIATFNWDPFLMQAYHRNRYSGLSLPKFSFLHGSVNIGYCKKDNTYGFLGEDCGKCYEKIIQTVPLLYPIRNKRNSENFM